MSALLVICIMYFVYCIIDTFSPATQSKLLHVEIYDGNRIIFSQSYEENERIIGITVPLSLKPGNVIIGSYEIRRLYTAENNIERIIRSPTREYIISNIRRTHTAGTTSIVSAEYHIPNSVPDDCEYNTLSRNTIVKSYNILTYIKPDVSQSQAIYFCIKR